MSTIARNLTSTEAKGYKTGDNPDVVKRRAAGFAARFTRRGGRLVIGLAYTKTGNLILTIAVAVGNQFFRSDSLDKLALGLGALTAVRFLIDATRYRNRAGGIAVAPGELNRWENMPGAHAGTWSGIEEWQE